MKTTGTFFSPAVSWSALFSRIFALWLGAAAALAQTAGAAHPASDNSAAQTRRLLEWLGVMPLLEQAPAALTAAIEAEAGFRNATPAQQAAWRRELEPRLRSQQLQTDLLAYIAERYKADTFRHIEQALQAPLAKRARFFDLAMTQSGSPRSLGELRTAAHSEPTPARRALAQEIDAAAATSQLVAVLQTGITERVRRAAGAEGGDDAALRAEIAERQRFLEPIAVDYTLYAYRYFRDEELVAYRDLLRDAQLQWLLDVSRQGLLAVLRGDVRPPDSPR